LGQWLSIDDGGTATLGLIYVVSGLGTGLGPLLMRRWLGDATKRLLIGISIGFLFTAIGIIMLGLVTTLSAFLISTFIRTIGTGTVWVFSSALLQTLTPDKVRGRVFAFEFAMLTLTQSLSIYAAGYVLDVVGWPLDQVTQVFGSFGLIVFIFWMVFILAGQKSLYKYESDQANSAAKSI
jgi:MFS family permease